MHIKGLRMCRGTKHKHHFMQALRREAQTLEESGPKRVEDKPITEANHFNSTPNHHGSSHKPHWSSPTEDGAIGPSQGALAPLVRPHPQLA